jgi:uncharacterized membrane protein YeaQ/YmgE (transglycosylase-associated protein family)
MMGTYVPIMGLIAYLISLAFIGLILGALARLALPGRDPMSIPQTIMVGIAGSFLGGLIGLLLFGHGGGGLFLSFLCSFAIVYAIRRSRGGDLTHPGGHNRPLHR